MHPIALLVSISPWLLTWQCDCTDKPEEGNLHNPWYGSKKLCFLQPPTKNEQNQTTNNLPRTAKECKPASSGMATSSIREPPHPTGRRPSGFDSHHCLAIFFGGGSPKNTRIFCPTCTSCLWTKIHLLGRTSVANPQNQFQNSRPALQHSGRCLRFMVSGDQIRLCQGLNRQSAKAATVSNKHEVNGGHKMRLFFRGPPPKNIYAVVLVGSL